MALLVVVGLSFWYQTRLDSKAADSVSIIPNPQRLFVTENQIKAKKVSTNFIAQLYHAPNLTHGLVLGDTTPAPLKQEEIADISTPAVVRIFNQVSGSISFKEFSIDLENFQLLPTNKTYTEQSTALVTGTGFFIDSEGHLLTNAHVIDKHALLDQFIGSAINYYGQVIEQQITNLTPAEKEALKQKLISTYGPDPNIAVGSFALDLEATIEDYINQKSNVDATQNITVLNSAKDGTKLNNLADVEKLAKEGFEARLVDWKANYKTSHDDVALLKVEKSPTPFLSINADSKPSTGQQIFVIGFPSNAEIDFSDLFNRTMTQGSINATKKLDGFEVYQTDAKISQGSSGSPMLNEKGEVIGIITYQKSALLGDNFGYATPIQSGKTLMSDNGINIYSNPSLASFTQGVNLAAQSLCRKANEQFATASNLDPAFANPNLQKYIDRCKATIAAGQSKDGTLYQAQEFIGKVPIYAWVGGVAFVLISLGSLFMLRRMKKLSPIIQSPTAAMT